MLFAFRTWRTVFANLFRALPRLIALNLIWLVCAWPLISLGAATVTAFAWLRGPNATWRDLWPLARRLWWPGTLWALINALVVFVWLSNLAYWPRVLPGLGQAVVLVTLLLLGWLWLALQPWWLDGLAGGLGCGHSLRGAAFNVGAAPAYALTCALPVLALLVLATMFRTFWALAGVCVVLAYWAGVVHEARVEKLNES